jgi:hypothetical protein
VNILRENILNFRHTSECGKWKPVRNSRCQSLLQKSDSSLRQELCSYGRNGTKSKDVLLILQECYPDYKPKYETPGWWYVPTEDILGRVCKKCNLLGVRMRTADPRYITHADDGNRRDVIIPMSTVRELIRLKEQFDEAVATIWLTTTDMGFALTDKQHMLLCPKDVREGKVIDRYLAPAISRFAIDIQTEETCQPTSDRAEEELRREIVNLHQRCSQGAQSNHRCKDRDRRICSHCSTFL